MVLHCHNLELMCPTWIVTFLEDTSWQKYLFGASYVWCWRPWCAVVPQGLCWAGKMGWPQSWFTFWGLEDLSETWWISPKVSWSFCGNANERFLVTRWRQNGQQICKQLMLGHMFIFQVPTCFLGPFLVHFHVGLPGLCHTNAQRLSHLLRWCHTPFAWRWRQMVDVGFGG